MLHLLLDFFVVEPLLSATQLEALHGLLSSELPTWSKGLAVASDEDAERRPVGPGESLSLALEEAAPAKFGLADAILSGSYEGLTFFAQSSRSTLPPESNVLSLEIVDRTEVEGLQPQIWAASFFRRLPSVLPVRYARAHLSDEFDAKNLDKTKGGVRAVGVQLTQSLPGLYWLNYLGAPYLKLLGGDRLLSAPAAEVQQIADGFLVALGSDPRDWEDPEYRDREHQTMKHLGPELFFDRNQPDRQTIAPDLRKNRPGTAAGAH